MRVHARTGIGAGNGTSGQVLVQLDMMGGFGKFKPRFVKQYMDLSAEAARAIAAYADDVKSSSFPEEGTHTYPMPPEAWQEFLRAHATAELSATRS